VKRDGGLGDILMLTAALSEYKRIHRAEITMQSKWNLLFNNNPDIKHTIPYDSNPDISKFNKVFDLDGAVEPTTIMSKGGLSVSDYMNTPRMDHWFAKLGINMSESPITKYFVTDNENKVANTILKGTTKPVITYILNATSPYRTYPIDLAMEALRELSNKYDIVIVGDHGMWGDNHQFNIRKRELLLGTNILDLTGMDCLTLRQIAAIMNASDIIISADTGPLHLAAAMNKLCIGLFGNIDPILRTSYYPSCLPLFHKMSCYCGDQAKTLGCPAGAAIENAGTRRIGADCMWKISPKEIVDSVRKATSHSTDIKSSLIHYCCGDGWSAGEQMVSNSNNIKGNLDWVYSGWSHTDGDEALRNFIISSTPKLKVGGKLIIHEPIARLFKTQNRRPLVLQSFYSTMKLMKDYKILLKEPLIHRNGFVIVGEKV